MGIACFLWAITSDLFAHPDEAVPLPEPLEAAGPLAFRLGRLILLALLVLLVTVPPPRLAVRSPLLMLAGFPLFAVCLDLLPLGALSC